MNNSGWVVLLSVLCFAIGSYSQQQQPPVTSPRPAAEIRSLTKALQGTWRITEQFEPNEWTPHGGNGYGDQRWRHGPGGLTLIEELHDRGAAGETFGLALIWFDREKGLQGIWCENSNPNGCDRKNALKSSWNGRQLMVDLEFERDGKPIVLHEVFSEITPSSFVQTVDIGEKGRPLKRWVTARATKAGTK